MNIGNQIKKYREQLKISQEELADKIFVTRQTISNWELGETSPNPDQLKLLSKALNISIDELLENDVNGLLMEKISNTEKLAGLVLKVLKWLGICFLVMLSIDVIAFIIYMFIK